MNNPLKNLIAYVGIPAQVLTCVLTIMEMPPVLSLLPLTLFGSITLVVGTIYQVGITKEELKNKEQ